MRRKIQSGVAAVEFALILPLLLLIFLGVVDTARAMQANMILLNLSRESASMASRQAVGIDSAASIQAILSAVAASAPPLDMGKRGMLYVTQVIGYNKGGVLQNVVRKQFRWDDIGRKMGASYTSYVPASKIWTCTQWDNSTGECLAVPTPDKAAPISLMAGKLNEGETMYVVETFYNFDMAVGVMTLAGIKTPQFGPNLYSMAVF